MPDLVSRRSHGLSLRTAFLLGAAASVGLILGSVALLVALHLHDGEDESGDD